MRTSLSSRATPCSRVQVFLSLIAVLPSLITHSYSRQLLSGVKRNSPIGLCKRLRCVVLAQAKSHIPLSGLWSFDCSGNSAVINCAGGRIQMRRLRFVVPASLVLSVLSFCGSALANSTVNGKLASIEGKSDSLGAKANDEGNFSYLQSSGNGSMGGEYMALPGMSPKIRSHGLVLHLAAVVLPEFVVVSTFP